jgi:DNA-binding NarL/FixJ family response regulator
VMKCNEVIPVTAIRVVLADDNRAMLTEIATRLGVGFEVIGTAEDGEETIRVVEQTEPNVLVLDISMPLLNGLQVAARLCKSGCRAKIVFLTIHEQASYISAAFSSGGSAFVTKRHLASDLAPAIRAVVDGQTFLSPSLRE